MTERAKGSSPGEDRPHRDGGASAGIGSGTEPPSSRGTHPGARPPARGGPAPTARPAEPERWIETGRGGLFFVNSLLIFPYVMLLVPLLTRMLVRGVGGGLPEASSIVDTFPLLAEYLAPRYGWLAIVPLVLVAKNLRIERARLPTMFLFGFLLLHGALLLWTLTGWVGLHGFGLPAGPPGP